MPVPRLYSVGIVACIAVGAGASAVVWANEATPSCEIPSTVTTAVELVEVSQEILETPQAPSVFFPTPLKTTGVERMMVRSGTGLEAIDGAALDFQAAVYFGQNGDFVTGTSYNPAEPLREVIDTGSTEFFNSQLACARPGDQIVFTATIEDVFGPIPEDELVKNDSTIVVVVDIQQVYLPRANGTPALPERGMPQVVEHPLGFHGVSFPMNPPPTDLRIQTTRQGSGEVLGEGDRVVVHYTGMVWETQNVFSASFDQEVPVTLDVLDGSAEGATAGVITGVYEALLGQRVGSQVIAVIPPGFGYPDGNQPPGVPDGSTLVYVIDILGIE